MTLVSDVIQQAYRETNLLPIGSVPTTNEQNEALPRLQSLLSSALGNEAGEKLAPFPIGANNIEAPIGYPAFVPVSSWWVPLNMRLILNLQGSQTVNLHPQPEDGSRFAILDASNNLAANPLTVNGNGRTIDGQTQEVFNTNGLVREWFYRADLGDWRVVANVGLSDQMPYPQEFDDMFITMLAMRINPRYGQNLTESSLAALDRNREQFRARYHQTITTPADPAVLRMSNQATYTNRWFYNAPYGPKWQFQSGFPW